MLGKIEYLVDNALEHYLLRVAPPRHVLPSLTVNGYRNWFLILIMDCLSRTPGTIVTRSGMDMARRCCHDLQNPSVFVFIANTCCSIRTCSPKDEGSNRVPICVWEKERFCEMRTVVRGQTWNSRIRSLLSFPTIYDWKSKITHPKTTFYCRTTSAHKKSW